MKTEIARSLRQLHLPAFVDNYDVQATVATNEGWAYDRYLVALCELELEERRQRKIERFLRESKLPREKTWAAFEQSRLPRTVERRVDALLEGDFLDRTENVLAFGNPGSGKTHLAGSAAPAGQGRAGVGERTQAARQVRIDSLKMLPNRGLLPH